MYIIEYLIILFYLFCFFLYCPLINRYSIIKKISKNRIINFFLKNGFFMSWSMFCKSPARRNRIKFIFELNNNKILIYYYDTEKTINCITDIIPELKLKSKSRASLIHHFYYKGHKIIDKIEEKIQYKFNNNLKCFSCYLEILRPSKSNPLNMYTSTYFPIIEKSYVNN